MAWASHLAKGIACLLFAATLLDPGPSFHKLTPKGRVVIWLMVTVALQVLTW